MGAYLYKTKPSHVARALIREGSVTREADVALYIYAYKPYSDWGDGRRMNQRMAFRYGVTACKAAWKRSATDVPLMGLIMSEVVMDDPSKGYEVAINARTPFQTRRASTVLDDYVTYYQDVEIVQWLSLPEGVRLQTMTDYAAERGKGIPFLPADRTALTVSVDNSGETFGAKVSIADLAQGSLAGAWARLNLIEAQAQMRNDWAWEIAQIAPQGEAFAVIFKDGSRVNVAA